jgi:hypothetical protein
MAQLNETLAHIHGQPPPPDEGAANVAFEELGEASKSMGAQMAKAQSAAVAHARALINDLKKAHAAKDKTRHDTRSKLLRKQAATAEHNKSVAIKFEQLQSGRHSHSKRKTLPPRPICTRPSKCPLSTLTRKDSRHCAGTSRASLCRDMDMCSSDGGWCWAPRRSP